VARRIAISTLIVRPGRSGSNEPYLTRLVRALGRLPTDDHYMLFVSAANRALFESLDRRFTLTVVPGGGIRGVRIAMDQLAVGLLARRSSADVLHYPGTVGAAIGWAVPQVVTVHYDLDPEHVQSVGRARRVYFRSLMARTIHAARVLVVPSHTFASTFSARWGVPRTKLRVVYHGVEAVPRGAAADRAADALLRRYGLTPGYVLCVTNDLPHKNVPTLLEAIARLHREGIATPLVLAGNVGANTVRRWVDDLSRRGISLPATGVTVTGVIRASEMGLLYRAAGMLVVPTLTESSSMPVLEAMAEGCPVVASNIPVHREIAGEAAILVDPHSAPAFVDAFGRVGADRTLRERLIDRGLAVAMRFTWDRAAEQMNAIYREAAV
jgi:glycosyltransferase involved in cell wall biosynthesis